MSVGAKCKYWAANSGARQGLRGRQAGRERREGRGKMAWWCLSVSLSPIDNICTFWSFERSGGGGRWRVMTSIVSRRERERGNWTSWSSQLCPPPASSQPASSEPQPPMLGSGAEISSVLCPQGHPSVDHKTVLDSWETISLFSLRINSPDFGIPVFGGKVISRLTNSQCTQSRAAAGL